jgi:hypothetical protein
MRSKPGLTRIVISLLFLRVLAAPIAARPDTDRPPSTDRFIVRVCAWPAQRPQRSTSASLLLPSFRGARRPDQGDWLAVSQAQASGSPGRSILARRVALSFHDTTAWRRLDRLRC